MSRHFKRTISIVLAVTYLVIITYLIINNSYDRQTIYLLLFFGITNLPLIAILIFHKSTKHLEQEITVKNKALYQSQKRWSELVELLPQVVFEYESSNSGHIAFINDYGLKLLGYKNLAATKNLRYTDLFDPHEREKIAAERDRISQSKSPSIADHICIKKDGSKFPVALYSAPIVDRNKTVGIRSIMIDLTEIKHIKETVDRLQTLDKTKDDFLNIAAHELKTPLTSLLVMSELLKNKSGKMNDPELSEQVGIIYTETVRLKKIVDQILTITRFENKRSISPAEVFDLIVVINNFSPTLKNLANTKNIKLDLNLEVTTAKVKANPDKIMEVLYNFVDNAAKYGDRKDNVKLTVAVEDHHLKISVKDSGKGIPPEKIKDMFTKFGQLELSLDRSQEGIGLGLYISRLIIESYGGRIGVDSKKNQGSTFYFTLPIVK